MGETPPPMWIEIEEDLHAWSRKSRWRWSLRRLDPRMPFGFSNAGYGAAKTRDKAEADARKCHEDRLAWYARHQERINL